MAVNPGKVRMEKRSMPRLYADGWVHNSQLEEGKPMLVGSTARRVAIVGGVRIPFARGHGAYAEVGNQEMLTAALRAVVERYGLHGQRLDDVAAGAVMKHSNQWNLARESVLGSGLPPETPGFDLQRACGTSLA